MAGRATIMVSSISPLMLQGQQTDLTGALLGGRQSFQENQLNNQAMEQNQQQISRADYLQGVERVKLLSKLATKARQLPPDQRQQFVGSLNENMLRSVGIDPAQTSSVPLDDQGLDAYIAQVNSIIPEDERGQYRKESVSTNQGLMVFDPSTGSYAPAKGSDGASLSAAQYDPNLQGEISSSRQQGKNISDMQFKPDIARNVAQAEADVKLSTSPEIERQIAAAKSAEERKTKALESDDKYNSLLSGFEEAKAIIPLSTGSTLGAIKDNAGKVIGFSSEAAQNSARLKALAAWLVTQVPKPGGAVSDADLAQFKKAVGNIDDNTPPEERLAAVDTAMSIINKYQSSLNGTSGSNVSEKTDKPKSKYTIEVMD